MYEEYLRFKDFENEEEEQEIIRKKKEKINKSLYKLYDEDYLEESCEDFEYDKERLGY